MTPPHQFERRRAEDVFKVVEDEVFPRLGAIDTKITSLEHGIQGLTIHGCAQRTSDLHRVEMMEQVTVRIFEKIDDIGKTLTAHQIKVTEQVGEIKVAAAKGEGGIKVWIYRGIIVVLLGLLIYFAKDYAHDLEMGIGKQPAVVTQPRK